MNHTADSKNKPFNRRQFVQAASVAGLMFGTRAHGGAEVPALSTPPDPWQAARAIEAGFAKPLAFRTQDFPITTYGAEPTDVVATTAWIAFSEQARVNTPVVDAHDCWTAIDSAIAACHQAGGGRVVIPAGNWYCAGPITLRSNVNLHLSAGAHVYFSNRPSDYAKHGAYPCGPNGNLTLTRWEGNDCLNYSPLIYAHGQDNIALTGEDWTSILDGQGGVSFADGSECWWSWKGRGNANGVSNIPDSFGKKHVKHHVGQTEISVNPLNPESLAGVAPHLTAAQMQFVQGPGDRWREDANYLRTLAEAGVPAEKRIFGAGHFLRPHMVQFISCTNVLFSGYQVTNTPFWQHNPVNCRNVHVKKVFANSMGPNSDGFDPESCDHVLIEDCQFNTGDDCIAIDSGKGPDTQYGPAQNIVVQNCRMQSGHGALTLGSIMSGGIQNVFAQNLVFENMHWRSDPLTIAIRLKTNMSRGGFIRNLHVRNISVPNGVATIPRMRTGLPGSLVPSETVATSRGGVITIDCGYDPASDNVRTRPPQVSGVHISNVTVGNVATRDGQHSCYQAIIVLGPVASDYNGPHTPPPVILPVSDITIRDCDFGSPVNVAEPCYFYNVQGLKLQNVRIGDKVHNESISV